MTKKTKPANGPKKGTSTKKPAAGAMSIATDSSKTDKQRVTAMAEAPLAVCESDKNLQSMLKVLSDKNEPVPVRLAAMESIQAASFSVVAFESCRADYIATLRAITNDADPEIRQRSLGVLARENDAFAEKKLLEGLRDPKKELVPPEKALQLLSYDVHAEAYPIAREIVKSSTNQLAKREALRLLAADAKAAPIFEKILLDKDEMRENRQIAASALHSLKPERLQSSAREILLDSSDYPEIQATSLTALSQFGDDEALGTDDDLLKSVDRLSTKGSTKFKQTARHFLSRYGR